MRMEMQAFTTGRGAIEPTLGLTNSGNLFYAAAHYSNEVELMRSEDQGHSWEVVSPSLGGVKTHQVTLDPFVYVDDSEGADRIFNIDLTVACSYLSYSDDEGETWTTNPLACGTPVNDHQTLFTGPPVSSPTIDYPNVVYYCFNDVASTSCTKSLDGGITFSATGQPAFPGVNDKAAMCGGINGHGVVDDSGVVYVPREYCGQAQLAISEDEGLTWKRVIVDDAVAKDDSGYLPDPTVAVDSKGTVYYVWIDDDHLPYLSISGDQGESWSKPMMVGAPGVKEANLPSIDVRSPGRVAIAYYGSSNAPHWERGGPQPKGSEYSQTTWYGYIAATTDALSKEPLFFTGAVSRTGDPLVRGECGPGRCGPVYDFIDVKIAPDGSAWASFVDACVEACAEGHGGNSASGVGIVGRLTGIYLR
jgi:hypothetical protein